MGYRSDLSDMVDEMNSAFPDSRAARDTEQLQRDIQQFCEIMNKRIDSLQRVWQSIEWWQSCDSVREDAQKAVDRYKMEKVMPHMTWVPNG